jgi:GTP-binding protein EngB required for normal cell division
MIPAGNYLLIGRTGAGKSSLINTIAQAPIAPVGNAYACTRNITMYSFNTPAGSYVLYDSPGFCEDDNPDTDDVYFKALRGFLAGQVSDDAEINLLFAVRTGNKRVRSEDFEVVKYLARLIAKFRIPVLLVATWADFADGGESVRCQLDQLRIQFLSMLDLALMKSTNRTLCANGFTGAYAVDNNSGAWHCSWSPIEVASKSPPDLYAAYESIIGHPAAFICEWINATGHNPEHLNASNMTKLLDGRIFNLTQYPLTSRQEVPDLINNPAVEIGNHSGEMPHFDIDSSTVLAATIDSVHQDILRIFRVRSTRVVHQVFRDLSEDYRKCVESLLHVAPSRGFSDTMCRHIVSLYAAREISLGLYRIAEVRKISILPWQVLAERITIFGQMLVRLLEASGDVYLSEQIILFVQATLHLPCEHEFDVLVAHLLNCSGMIYLATVYTEWACYPRSQDEQIHSYWFPDMSNTIEWLGESSGMPYSATILLENLNPKPRASRASAFIALAKTQPRCMQMLLNHAHGRLQGESWLVSKRQMNQILLEKAARAHQACVIPDNSWDADYYPPWHEDES